MSSCEPCRKVPATKGELLPKKVLANDESPVDESLRSIFLFCEKYGWYPWCSMTGLLSESFTKQQHRREGYGNVVHRNVLA
ncbi:unnamed protein product [Chondrus crispus]|uniref:Uncharacterized protein n=1 Tax=Chondrus crispus TaxID=2769 RepID=R7Q0V2_CHOCR|nr:unnamed protein product [Chondrus crispus]CDF32277.1 unnamed protein product [Chondrus crispus]|eukprot:XP_005711942.1 unnamed protein product [Chondrus crispus]